MGCAGKPEARPIGICLTADSGQIDWLGVVAGLDPAIHLLRKKLYAKVMGPRVTPGTKCPGARVTALVDAGAKSNRPESALVPDAGLAQMLAAVHANAFPGHDGRDLDQEQRRARHIDRPDSLPER